MRRFRLTIRTLRFAALAALVLCAQSLALTHEFLHEAGSDTEICTTCSIAGGVKHALADTSPSIPEPASRPIAVHTTAVVHTERPTTTPEARGPPTHS